MIEKYVAFEQTVLDDWILMTDRQLDRRLILMIYKLNLTLTYIFGG